jgi:hypothetical protein
MAARGQPREVFAGLEREFARFKQGNAATASHRYASLAHLGTRSSSLPAHWDCRYYLLPGLAN